MRNNIKIYSIITLCLLMISSFLTAAVQNNPKNNPKNEKVIQILLSGETEIPKGELERRTFRIGDEISYTLANKSTLRGIIVGFSGSEVIIKKKDDVVKFSIDISRFTKIRKITKREKRLQVLRIGMLVTSTVAVLLAERQLNKSENRSGDSTFEIGSLFRFFVTVTFAIAYLLMIGIAVFGTVIMAFLGYKSKSSIFNKKGMNLKIVEVPIAE